MINIGKFIKTNKTDLDNKIKNIVINKNAYGETDSSLEYFQNHRNKLDDLYPSERHFLEPTLKNINSVLDVGCAAGGSFSFCQEANPSLNYNGIDISNNLIQLAKQIYPNGEFIDYDGNKLPFTDNQFDLVFSLGVLHHIQHWKNLIIQMIDISKQFTIFDLRLTKRGTLNDPENFYQKVNFNNESNDNLIIPYLVINYNELFEFVNKFFLNNRYRIESYGYYSKPTQLANIPYNRVFMCSFKIEKNSEFPGVFINF